MMKFIRTLSHGLTIASVLFASTGAVQAETVMTDHQHGHAEKQHAVSELSLDHGKKWQTDAPLRRGMQHINDAVMHAVPAYHDDTLSKSEADELAGQINAQIEYMIANCKLEPAADATLHVLIGKLLTGAASLENDPLSSQGLPHIVSTLHQYSEYFAHPGLNKTTEK